MQDGGGRGKEACDLKADEDEENEAGIREE